MKVRFPLVAYGGFMARLTLYFCDLCNEPSKQELEFEINLSWKHEKSLRTAKGKNTKNKKGDICQRCYNALVLKLEQEATPVLPKATTKNTPSEKENLPAPPPKKTSDSIIGMDNGIPLLESEVRRRPSNWNNERKRKILKEQLKQGCRHNNGYSMDDNGQFLCKDCRERVNI